MSDQPLDALTISEYLCEVADELDDHDSQRTVIVAGGALLALHGLREATRDVDSVLQLDKELQGAVVRVAARHDLAPKWLNDSAAAFVPATFNIEDCELILDRASLLVLGAPLDQVFLMKLFASRAIDTDDLETLWPHCTFESPELAVEAFYAAYPFEEPDRHLAEHLRVILNL